MSLTPLLHGIRACTHCVPHLPLGPNPVVRASAKARLLIIGQAPGTRVHESGIPWNDKSGERLRQWLNISNANFYNDNKVAIMPMGFCYPGVNAKGGDLPPRRECAPLWHDALLAQLPEIQLTLLVGQYAQQRYLNIKKSQTLTATVMGFEQYLPRYCPLPHPSWRTIGWQKNNPWFEQKLLRCLREILEPLLV